METTKDRYDEAIAALFRIYSRTKESRLNDFARFYPKEVFESVVNYCWFLPSSDGSPVTCTGIENSPENQEDREIAHQLFAIVAPDLCMSQEPNDPQTGQRCGCLTQIRRDYRNYQGDIGYVAYGSADLTSAIQKDTRIPHEVELVKPSDLRTFADWQRRIDQHYGRV